MDIRSILFMSVAVVAWQVVLSEYPIGTPPTVTPFPITQTYVTVTQSPNPPTTTTTTTTPNPVPTSTTTKVPPIFTISIATGTPPVITNNTVTSVTSQNTVTSVTSQNTSAGSRKVTYSGYLILNSTVANTSLLINQTELEDWLKNRTNRSREFKILMFNQDAGNSSRKKRNVDETSLVIFEVETNASDFHEEFKNTENISSTSTIRSNKVEKAFLWLKGQSVPCPYPSNCTNGQCLMSDNGTFSCVSPSGVVGTTNYLGLIAIPCIIVLILLVILIIFLVRRKRSKERQKQDITKIHPAAFSKSDDYVDTATKRSLEGFNSVKSSNFEYESHTLETGLY